MAALHFSRIQERMYRLQTECQFQNLIFQHLTRFSFLQSILFHFAFIIAEKFLRCTKVSGTTTKKSSTIIKIRFNQLNRVKLKTRTYFEIYRMFICFHMFSTLRPKQQNKLGALSRTKNKNVSERNTS